MHELSIALSLIDAISDELPTLGPVRIREVRVRVGARSGVAADALTFAFDVAAEGTAVAGARIAIEQTPGAELELAALEVIDDDGTDC